MRALLDADLELSGNSLIDGYLGTRYSLTPDAAWIIRRLQEEGDIERLIQCLVVNKCLPEAEAKGSVYALLGQLGEFGIVRMAWERSLTGYGLVRLGLRWKRRRRATPLGFFLSMLQAYGWLALIFTTIFYVAHLFLGSIWPQQLAIVPGLLFGTCMVHEAGHALTAKYIKLPTVFLAHPGYASIMYVRPTTGVGRWVAATGPLLACAVCMLAVTHCSTPWNLLFIGSGALQLVSLLPWCADGKTIWRKHETKQSK